MHNANRARIAKQEKKKPSRVADWRGGSIGVIANDCRGDKLKGSRQARGNIRYTRIKDTRKDGGGKNEEEIKAPKRQRN